MTYVTHTFEAATPIEDNFIFKLGSKQCCLIITLYEKDGSSAITLPLASNDAETILYNLQGMRIDNPTKGIYIQNKKKVFIR